jgi:hypothetical protein
MANYSGNINIPYFQGGPYVSNNQDFQRDYDRRRGMLTKIQEGRYPLLRLLLANAKNGAEVFTDPEPRWGLEYDRLPRIYFAANSGSSGSGSYEVEDLLYVANDDAARLQVGDIFANMGTYTNAARTTVPTTTKTAANSVPELIKVLTVYGEGSGTASTNTKIRVRRNHGGGLTGSPAELLFASGASSGDGVAKNAGMFLWKAGNAMAEGEDDQQIYSDQIAEDYNYCQIFMRKWGATETDQNTHKNYTPEKAFQRNARKQLDEFMQELEVAALLGARSKEVVSGKTKWWAGGLMEFIDPGNFIGYNDTLFNTKNFNSEFKDKFYYGSQTKALVMGSDFYTGMSNMLDNKVVLNTMSIPEWSIKLQVFDVTNGGKVILVPSDTLSLNGMSESAFLVDFDHFKYGHLQNMDIKSQTLPATNVHQMTGEVYGQVTFKRTNPKAHFAFVKV